MFRASKTALSLILVLAAGMVVTACGEDRSHLFPGETVREITANIDTVQRLVDEGQCFEALKAADAVQDQAEALPSTVDPKLKRSLIDGVVTLTIRVGRQCEEDPSNGTTGDTEPDETDTEVTPTGETGPTGDETTTGPTGKKDKQQTEEPSTPDKPSDKPTKPTKPDPEPNTPVTPTPPENTPPTDTGPGSGGISPNP